MWFDCVVIDNIFIDGRLETYHIRASDNKAFPVDKLEDIDHSYREASSVDRGTLRIYEPGRVVTQVLKSKLRNVAGNDKEFLVQFDHFAIPVTFGYYEALFPIGWRLAEINIYDPYSDGNDPSAKRPYRNVRLGWDPTRRVSFAQILLQSKRDTFSLGVIARLVPADAQEQFLEAERSLSVVFTEPRHNGHFLEESYKKAADTVLAECASDQQKMPGVNLGLSGPSVDVVAWSRYLATKVRRAIGKGKSTPR